MWIGFERSQHKLGTMRIWRTMFGILVLVLLAVSAWICIPPFPAPAVLVNDPLSVLTAKLGPPIGYAPRLDPTSFHWVKNRRPAMWSLIIAFNFRGPVKGSDHPESVERCLLINSVAVWPLCEFVTRARVMVPKRSNDRG
jgi:hypothetical protein